MLNRTTQYNVTASRVFIALNIASAIGAICVTAMFAANSLSNASFSQWIALTPIYAFAHVIWLFGIALLGGPVWIVMHSSGLRHWIDAGLAGGTLLGIGCLALTTCFFTGYSDSLIEATNGTGQWTWKDHHMTADGWADAIIFSLWISAFGVILGVIIWRIAYRRAVV